MIKSCISSILSNTNRDFELLVIDQSTNDGTRKIVEQYISCDSRVRYMHMDAKGLSKARNLGAQIVKSDIIAYTDDDCVVDKEWIGKIRVIFRQRNVDIIFGSVLLDSDNTNSEFIPSVEYKKEIIFKPWMFVLTCGRGANMSMRRRVFEELCGFDEKMGAGAYIPAGEEVDFLYRAIKNKYPVLLSPLPQVTHYGIRNQVEFKNLMKGYQVATYSFFAKHIRCYDYSAGLLFLVIFFCESVQYIKFALFGKKILPWDRIINVWYVLFFHMKYTLLGIIKGFQLAVDKEKKLFK